jgi:hypothetical protein
MSSFRCAIFDVLIGGCFDDDQVDYFPHNKMAERFMNLEKVIFGFFLVLALTLSVAFVVSAPVLIISDNVWIMFAALLVNIIATVLKLGDRSQVGALLLATALVADLQLITAAAIWGFASNSPDVAVTILAMGVGALVANVVSVTILVTDILIAGR